MPNWLVQVPTHFRDPMVGAYPSITEDAIICHHFWCMYVVSLFSPCRFLGVFYLSYSPPSDSWVGTHVTGFFQTWATQASSLPSWQLRVWGTLSPPLWRWRTCLNWSLGHWRGSANVGKGFLFGVPDEDGDGDGDGDGDDDGDDDDDDDDGDGPNESLNGISGHASLIFGKKNMQVLEHGFNWSSGTLTSQKDGCLMLFHHPDEQILAPVPSTVAATPTLLNQFLCHIP